jgi:hypothetical protein
MSIDLSTFWTTWGVFSGDTSSTNQYDLWRGIIMGSGGTPTPPVTKTATISPTGIQAFNNVILSATTNVTSPTYVWTLSNFKNTTGGTITSYTGQSVTEGYFTTSGSSNVSLVVTGGDGTASATTFTVSAFTPTSVTNIKAWYDATQGVTLVGGDVDVWVDQSGNGYTVTSPSAAERPLYGTATLNGINILSSPTGQKRLNTGATNLALDPTAAGATMFMVGTQYAGDESYGRFLSADFLTQGLIAREAGNDAIIGGYIAGAAPFGSSASTTNGTFYTIGVSGNTTENIATLNENSVIGQVYPYFGTYAAAPMTLFASNISEGGTYDSRKAMAEIIIYSRTLNNSEYAQVCRYLRNKWQHY